MKNEDDWQAGDLALCVHTDDVPIYHRGAYGIAGRKLRKGAIYTVSSTHVKDGSLLLNLLELRDHPRNPFAAALRFRKIKPHIPDAEDAETIRLLNGQPAKENV